MPNWLKNFLHIYMFYFNRLHKYINVDSIMKGDTARLAYSHSRYFKTYDIGCQKNIWTDRSVTINQSGFCWIYTSSQLDLKSNTTWVGIIAV